MYSNLIIQSLEAIRPLSDDLKEHLRSVIKIKELKKKDLLLKQGRVCDKIYFILDGVVHCYYENGDKMVSSWFMQTGDVIISVQSFFKQQPSYESIAALSPCLLGYIEYSELQDIYDKFEEFCRVGLILTQKYYGLQSDFLYKTRMKRGPDLVKFIDNYFPELFQKVPAKLLASYVGLSESHFSVVKNNYYNNVFL